MSEETANTLAAAREYIDEHGWTKYELEQPDGSVCSLGAIVCTLGLDINFPLITAEPRVVRAAKALVQAIPEEIVAVVRSHNAGVMITNWNDDHVYEVQTILDTFAKAEKIERAGFDPDAA